MRQISKDDKRKEFSGDHTDINTEEFSGNETILIAEDEDMLRELVASALRSFGYNTIKARDGEEALEIYRTKQAEIDLVISDMLMPNKGGVELFKELKHIDPDVKFILVTGYSLADKDEKIFKEMKAVLKKPYTPINMARLIRDFLDT